MNAQRFHSKDSVGSCYNSEILKIAQMSNNRNYGNKQWNIELLT